jgi:hypothetical protein
LHCDHASGHGVFDLDQPLLLEGKI